MLAIIKTGGEAIKEFQYNLYQKIRKIVFVEFLKKRAAEEKSKKNFKPKIKFQNWPLKIKSKLNKEEIYF